MLSEKNRNGIKVKEKREKENLKIKEFKKAVKFIFENLLKFLTFSQVEKYARNSNWIWFEKEKGK